MTPGKTTGTLGGALRRHTASISMALFAAITLGACGSDDKETAATPPPAQERRPNILLIVADDLGYSDIGAFGSEISTPNLDLLAAEGRLLLNHHTSTSCAPTRATLHAGTDQHLTGIGNQSIASYQQGKPGYEGYLNERSLYMPELLRDGGYHTYIAGKWHIGSRDDQLPPSRGYERSYVLLSGVANHFGDRPENPLPGNKGPYREDGQPVTPPPEFYSTDFYTDRLIDYIDENLADGKPFFAFAAYTSPHWPLQAPPEFIDRYHGRYDVGYDAIRNARFQRQKALGIVPPDAELPAPADIPEEAQMYPGRRNAGGYPLWHALSAEQKADEARRMEIYAAMVENLDYNIGRLIRYLKQKGQYDNTLIVFHSDNGPEATDFGSSNGYDNSLQNLGRYGSYAAIKQGWSEVSNIPNRFYKAFPTEGGHRVPTIVRLPGQHSPQPPIHALTTIEDWLPTFIDYAGIPNPGSNYKGREVNPITGYSLRGLLENQVPDVRDADTVWAGEQFNRRYLYKGEWKITYLEPPLGTGDWQLYNLANDRFETRDLAAERPDKLAELKAEWDAYVQRFGVVLPPEEAE